MDDPPCRESRSELDKKDELFTRHLSRIFEAIKRTEMAAASEGHGPGKIHLTIFTPHRIVDAEFCRHLRSSAWRLRLLDPQCLPYLQSIRGLSIRKSDWFLERSGAHSRLDPRAVIDLAQRCPDLGYLGCEFGIGEWKLPNADSARQHFERYFEGCARDARHS